jgi:multiple sugar transport system substrate-binding protein
MASHDRVRRSALATSVATAAMVFGATGVVAQDNATTIGSNYSDPVPKAAMQAMFDYCQEQEGITLTVNTIEHNAFQEQLNSYLQGTPDDLFTWFAGYRMQFFADQDLATPISDVWAEVGDNYSEAFKKASTGHDGEQYFIPIYNYPWVVIYRKSLFEEKGYQPPADWPSFLALAEQMQADGIVPLAFADKQGWPAMGTFDILNMRLNGYDFHVGLMAGTEKWTDPRVKGVFEKWRELLPYVQEGALGRDWQEAAQALMNKEAGMYFLGTFAAEQAQTPEDLADLDFFPFPTLGTEFDSELGIDAPIDGFMLSKAPANIDAAKKFLRCAATGAAQIVYLTGNPAAGVAAGNDADTSGYTPLQQKSAEIIGASGAIAQFLDRDTRPDFVSPYVIPALQSFLGDPDQDLDAFLAGLQAGWDSLPTLE